MGEGRRANPWKELLAGCYTDLSPNAPHGPRRPKLAARLFPIPMLLTAPSQRKRIRWTSTIKGTSTGSFLLVGLRSCVARPARSRRIKRRSSSWSSTPSGNYLKQSWPTTRTAPSQVASRSYSSCRARHDTGIVRPQPPRVGDGRLPRPTFHVGHGTRSFRRLMVSILGRFAAAQPPHGGGSGICEPRAWGLVSWELGAAPGKTFPPLLPSAPPSLAPQTG